MMNMTDFKTLARPKSPNTYLLAPEGLCQNETPDEVSRDVPLAPDALYQRVLEMVDAQDRWVLGDTDAEHTLIHFVARSKLMGFKDDVDVLIRPLENSEGNERVGSQIAIYSRSRTGYSDMGANKKRVSFMLENLNSLHKTA